MAIHNNTIQDPHLKFYCCQNDANVKSEAKQGKIEKKNRDSSKVVAFFFLTSFLDRKEEGKREKESSWGRSEACCVPI